MDRLAVVGDVHGSIDRLDDMLHRLESDARHVVFVGDYVNGEPDSAKVLDKLGGLAGTAPDRFTFLCGNHDLALLQYLNDGDFPRFTRTGGLATLASYLPLVSGDVHHEFVKAFPQAHLSFLTALETFWESDELLVSHAGFDPARPKARDRTTLASETGWPVFGAANPPRPLVVCGHYVQRDGPFVSEHLICVDTGCGMIPGGRLTAVLLPEREFVVV